jgi:hypothetical protein
MVITLSYKLVGLEQFVRRSDGSAVSEKRTCLYAARDRPTEPQSGEE